MKILLCSYAPLARELGSAKVLIELAEAFQILGWDCDLKSTVEFRKTSSGNLSALKNSALKNEVAGFRDYLQTIAHTYDVIDFPCERLPYSRDLFPKSTLMVARSALLMHHFEKISIPVAGFRAIASQVIKAIPNKVDFRHRLRLAQYTLEQADLVNVSNHADKQELMSRGINAEKIVVLPYGMGMIQRQLFERVSSDIPLEPLVAFVGTFDWRKGAADFPKIVRRVVNHIPSVRFRILGTTYKNAEQVLAAFPAILRQSIEVIPTFSPEELPKLLAPCSVGIFPSYIEGFGFGVLEMLAAAIPVIAYDAPGPPMMLPEAYLVGRGDVQAMSSKVIALLQHPEQLTLARRWAQERAKEFCWKTIAQETAQIYEQRVRALRLGT